MDDLTGRASKGSIRMLSGANVEVDPGLAIFPICKGEPNGVWLPWGTGFFVTTTGIFVTAAHVLFEKDGSKSAESFFAIQFIQGGYVFRPILSAATRFDVAVGTTAAMDFPHGPLLCKVMALSDSRPVQDARACTYAYPGGSATVHRIDLRADYFEGEVVEYFPHGRLPDLPGPTYYTTINLHGGSSGGPVMGPDGKVFGVNRAAHPPPNTDVSYVSSIESALDIPINDVIILPDPKPRTTSLREISYGL